METQSQDTTQKTRLEAARQAALGTLSRARETLQVAATTVPAWARGVETKAGEQVDALLERVGLVRIAKVAATRPSESAETVTAAEAPAEAPAEAVEASDDTTTVSADATTDVAAEATTDATTETETTADAGAEATEATSGATTHGNGNHSSSKRRRR